MKQVFITTDDNPFDPSVDYNSWLQFDKEKGYHSQEYLARIANTSEELTDEEYTEEIERAIDEIIKFDLEDIYRKIVIE